MSPCHTIHITPVHDDRIAHIDDLEDILHDLDLIHSCLWKHQFWLRERTLTSESDRPNKSNILNQKPNKLILVRSHSATNKYVRN